MQWRDSAERYGLVTRILHWTIAALLLWQLIGMALKMSLGRHPLVALFVQVHQPIGWAILLLVLVRVFWALRNRRQRPGHGDGALARLAGLGQKAMYLLMLVVPMLGIVRANTRMARPGGPGPRPGATPEVAGATPALPPGGEADSGLALLGAVHGLLAWTLLLLIVGHVAMAVLHARIWRDGATDSMFGRIRG